MNDYKLDLKFVLNIINDDVFSSDELVIALSIIGSNVNTYCLSLHGPLNFNLQYGNIFDTLNTISKLQHHKSKDYYEHNIHHRSRYGGIYFGLNYNTINKINKTKASNFTNPMISHSLKYLIETNQIIPLDIEDDNILYIDGLFVFADKIDINCNHQALLILEDNKTSEYKIKF